MEEYTLYLNPDTRDLALDSSGDMQTIEGSLATAQNIRNTLLVYKREFPLFEPHGTDYGRILGQKVSELERDEANEVIREAVFQDGNLRQIDRLSVRVDGRTAIVELEGELYSGEKINVGVNAG